VRERERKSVLAIYKCLCVCVCLCGVSLQNLKLQIGDKMLINFKDIFWDLEKNAWLCKNSD
jgi:hypothetical protein